MRALMLLALARFFLVVPLLCIVTSAYAQKTTSNGVFL